MPTFIVKADPAEDFYVMWSTVVDCPTGWGTRAELERDCRYGEIRMHPERFQRADELGSSAMPGVPFFHWEDTEWGVRECIPEWRLIARSDLKAFCEAFGRDDIDGMIAATSPYPDDDDDA